MLDAPCADTRTSVTSRMCSTHQAQREPRITPHGNGHRAGPLQPQRRPRRRGPARPQGREGRPDRRSATCAAQEGFFHYRQYDATELAKKRTLEDIWHLMHEGELPADAGRERRVPRAGRQAARRRVDPGRAARARPRRRRRHDQARRDRHAARAHRRRRCARGLEAVARPARRTRSRSSAPAPSR